MPQLDVLDTENKKVGNIEAATSVFDVKVNNHLIKQYVVLQQASRRLGTACTKSSYGQLSGSGKKPWRQKGTGRARVGKTRSAIWRGGLTIFGPTQRDYSFKMNKKARKQALRSALTDCFQGNHIAVVDKIDLEKPKTKEVVRIIKSLGLPEKTLFLVSEKNENLELAVRNLPTVNVLPVEGLNVYDLLLHEKIVCTPETVKKLEERLG
ncbi:MAG TPA: 50S ribosomal protein L4 [Nitrospinaceae bacterium]|jgi:large subunit ribosomal protein L4|nr:50S ribosomal protein L4 [Nitrospinaceae bacterium]HAK37125.1 50S ribosomal protein L4 [Nitrospina sp.]MDP6476916.1 50S ribosomal protein L4 [Nitrospinaceae bacterium]MDP6656971.1 50S ribosomal protein L4 [Nitrospinaceae bacterium]MDP6711724.1 50S ribosomal protein L4 [Nitrospinaceae bacterium]|tara:strand:- start:2724 stop:3350 length:627 start_codon:yes stop_codon:yes gene_type:complete